MTLKSAPSGDGLKYEEEFHIGIVTFRGLLFSSALPSLCLLRKVNHFNVFHLKSLLRVLLQLFLYNIEPS